MRSTTAWRADLIRQLRNHWPQQATMRNSLFCEIELGIFAVEQLLPNEPIRVLWTLLTGYTYASPQMNTWSEDQKRAVHILRHLLPYYRSAFVWQSALRQYMTTPAHLRGYEIDQQLDRYTRRKLTIGAKRWEIYAKALSEPPAYRTTRVRWATAGSYTFTEGRLRSSVTIPSTISLPAIPSGHQYTRQRKPFRVTFEQLVETARWMDHTLNDPKCTWQKRMERVQLETFDDTRTTLHKAEILVINGTIHIVGMVSVGKSTLMDVVAVFAAQHGYRITLIVGDVMSALDRAVLFTELGLSAAPILGGSNRERHLSRLHRATITAEAAPTLPAHHGGFRWLSTACALDGLRDIERPLPVNSRPCLSLFSYQNDDTNTQEERWACPFYGNCVYHQAQRDLIDAAIWIATPASLIYTRVAPQITAEQLRFAELAIACSDLIVIDEADRVQIQLDNIFSPSQNLISRAADAWLSQLAQQVTQQLSREGRGQLAEPHIALWCQAHDLVQLAASRVYSLLLQSERLQREIERDYFTAWMLLERLAHTLSNYNSDRPQQRTRYEQIMAIFEACVDDPLGEQHDHQLAELSRRCITATSDQTRSEVIAWLTTQHHAGEQHEEAIARLGELFEFALVVAVLSNRLDVIIREWRHVEVPLQLEGASSQLFHRPPDDYTAELPAAPMGNVLAFQYLRNGEDPDGPGNLQFFRCMGVGRWLLLALHSRFALAPHPGPHVLLLSATSWAGTAPGYDLQIPVTGILSAPAKEIQAMQQSQFVLQREVVQMCLRRWLSTRAACLT